MNSLTRRRRKVVSKSPPVVQDGPSDDLPVADPIPPVESSPDVEVRPSDDLPVEAAKPPVRTKKSIKQ